jgi:hypothetical protein
VFAIVECAFDESFLDNPFWARSLCGSLCENSVLRGFGSASPFLMRAPETEDGISQWIEHLLEECGTRPMKFHYIATKYGRSGYSLIPVSDCL